MDFQKVRLIWQRFSDVKHSKVIMKILLLSKYSRLGASSRLRALQYIPYLQEYGHTVSVHCLFDDAYLEMLYTAKKRSPLLMMKLYLSRLIVLLTAWRYDIVWIEKEVAPYCPPVFEWLLKKFGMPYVVDYDDAIFHNYDMSPSVYVRKLLGRKIDSVMRNASCVVAGNDYLADRAVKAGALNVHVVPTVVDIMRYQIRAVKVMSSLKIGWIGSPSTEKYVVGIRQALIKASKQHSFRLVLMGASADVVKELSGLDVEVLPWSEDHENAFIQSLDVGIMPLIDGPWEKGKCGYKLIQYMACGVPVIATPVGVNVKIVFDNKCGLLAADLKEWETSLVQLLSDPVGRENYGAAGRYAVENEYSLGVQAPRLAKILERAACK